MTALPRMTIAEMGQTSMIVRQVDMWAAGGDMRAISGADPSPPASSLERASIIAFDAMMGSEANSGRTPSDRGHTVRDQAIELLHVGLRLAIADERQNGDRGGTDVDRARQILVSMAMVQVARDHHDGMEPAPLANPILEAARLRSGIEASALSRDDAVALGNGMGDMVGGQPAVAQIRDAMDRAFSPSRNDVLEARLTMGDATWPSVKVRESVENAVAAKSFDASAPAVALQREAADRASRASGR